MSRRPEKPDPIAAFAMNLKRMAETRARIGRLQLDSNENGAAQLTKVSEKYYLKWINENNGTFREDVLRDANGLASVGLPKTPALVTCNYLDYFSEIIKRSAVNLLFQGGESQLIGAVQMDFEKGFTIELSAVTNAALESQDQPKNEEERLSRFDRRLGYSMLEIAVAEKVAQRSLKQIARLLQDDPAGFSVLRYQLQQFEIAKELSGQETSIRNYEIPEIVIAGAKLALAKYQELYPQVSAVLSSSANS